MNVYDFDAVKLDGEEISLGDYKGKVLLIVNTATGCGFTPQYVELQEMYDKYNEKGFEILDFPCNQFANQAPGTNEEIHDFCVSKYALTFPQFAKINVNGENAAPLYKWLTSNTTFKGLKGPMKVVMSPILKKMDKDYKNNGNIKWNFTKFLIDKNGNIIDRFEPTDDLNEINKKIEELL